MQQRYKLTIWGLFTMSGSDACGAQAVIGIMDSEKEVDRMTITGKWQSPSGYRRSYTGKSGLTAQLLSGPGELSYVWEKDEADPYRPVIAWRRRLSNPPGCDPVEVDVQDGRAEYLLSGPYSIGEGGRIEVVDGKLLFTGSNFKIN